MWVYLHLGVLFIELEVVGLLFEEGDLFGVAGIPLGLWSTCGAGSFSGGARN
jgi:hypothetical protein